MKRLHWITGEAGRSKKGPRNYLMVSNGIARKACRNFFARGGTRVLMGGGTQNHLPLDGGGIPHIFQP